jgi:hypothetical protein
MMLRLPLEIIDLGQLRHWVRVSFDHQFESFSNSAQQQFKQDLSGILNVQSAEIDIAYVAPGGVVAVIEMKSDARDRLMQVLYANPEVVSALAIKKVGFITPDNLDLSGIKYEQGLLRLAELLLQGAAHLLPEFRVLEARLCENLKSERIYGTTEIVRSARAQIIGTLNEITSPADLKHSFNDLCQG